MKIPRLVVSAPHRSGGKSTVSTGLCAAYSRRGLKVQPFKKGPDFIDPMWLSAAAGRQCRNLDFFFMTPERIGMAFAAAAADAELSVVECNHGLHDGMDPEGGDSSAALARLLDAPVLLVVNAARLSRGIAPLVRGQVDFDPAVKVAGIILNRVGSSRHEKKVRAALERYCEVPVVGALPSLPELEVAERHLGLTPLQERPELEDRHGKMGEAAERYLDLDLILEIAGRASALPLNDQPASASRPGGEAVKIGVARDRVFNFYYPENIEALEAAGAAVVHFSPLEDSHLPEVDGLYLGGGFPEFFMESLEGNAAMREEVRRAVERGMPVWAECGGLMYLSRSLEWKGERRAMAGVFPCDIEMFDRPAGHGYTILEGTGNADWLKGEGALRGHEFHHSRVVKIDGDTDFAFRVLRGGGIVDGFDGLMRRNCIATYTHLHADGSPSWAKDFVAFVRTVSKG